MRRVIRKAVRAAVAGFCLLSLLGAVGAGWLWWRSGHAGPDRVSFRSGGGRYSIRSDHGRVTLLRPPPPPAGTAAAGDADLAGQVRNEDLRWWTHVIDVADRPAIFLNLWVSAAPGSPAEPLLYSGFGAPAGPVVRPLLDALDDPGRFAAAHVLLTQATKGWQSPPPPTGFKFRYRRDPRFLDGVVRVPYLGNAEAGRRGAGYAVTLDGVLRLDFPDASGTTEYFDDYDLLWHTAVVPPDPAQLPAVRDYWHDRLDVPVLSVRHGWAVAAPAVPPLLWLGTFSRRSWVRRRRLRRGLCRWCGYDLRASASGRCSECGAAAVTKGVAA